jgi:putative transposase
MLGMRKQYEAAFKAKVALEALKGEKTIAQIASGYSVHPNQVRQWRQHLLEMLPEVFSNRRPQQERARDDMEAELYRQIGQLKVELEWLKKNLSRSCRKEARDDRARTSEDIRRPAM